MRIGIREQLGLLVLFASLVSLAVVSIAVWIENEHYVLGITSKGLSLTASLKAAEISSDLVLIQSTCGTITTRILIQQALQHFYLGNTSDSNWVRATQDTQSALSSGGSTISLLQLKVFPRNNTGNTFGLLNTTVGTDIVLPYTNSNGSAVHLGDDGLGYPPELYPNFTYTKTNQIDPTDPTTNLTLVSAFPGVFLNSTSTLFLGPLQVNSTLSVVSLTLPIINNTSATDVLGYMTILSEASDLMNVMTSREGLDNTGIVLILGPAQVDNMFPADDQPSSRSFKGNRTTLGNELVNFVFPPEVIQGVSNRHNLYNGPFSLQRYPAALDSFVNQHNSINNASSNLSTKNEQNVSISVGYARPTSTLVDWVIIVEQAHAEAWAPIVRLRNILLACVFGTAGVTLILVFPIAHFSVRPIRRLRDATEKSVQPPGYTPGTSIHSGMDDGNEHGRMPGDGEFTDETPYTNQAKGRNGFWFALRNLRHKRRRSNIEKTEDARRRVFKVPGKVQDRRHFITDELTELTGTFNEMSDELMMQYSRLEERVAERTRELEISKKAAEAANESKTLFIANISHELKTPLNGILGMCAVCMGEDDLPRIKRSLQVVYKSGDLLLHLLNDLLTFSKNQIGQQLSLEEKEFRLHDIRTQITTIFDKQVRDARIDFGVVFLSTEESNQEEKSLPAYGPDGTGRLKDMSLWGDQHRILQVIINLVSNSLKFTPQGGRVQVRIRCVGEKEKSNESSRLGSIGSKQSSQRLSKNRSRGGSASNHSASSRVPSSSVKPGTALLINPMDPKAAPHVAVFERPQTPPPSNARTLIFEFEVEDTGPGIPEAMQQRVFEPFVQGDLGLSKKYGGTGLGLSICSQLAGLMGGSITLKSTVGVGTTFNMRIPLKFVKQRAASTNSSEAQKDDPSRPSSIISHNAHSINSESTPANPAIGFDKDAQPRLVGLSQPFFASPAPTPAVGSGSRVSDEHLASTSIYTGGSSPTMHAVASALDRVGKRKEGKIRVLVAEDNLVNQEVVLRMLKLEDIYDVTVAKDGQEAFDTVKAVMDEGKRFDLIFMDIQMPNLDGLQSTRLIRQMGYSAPIVALTAFADEINVKQCMDSGMDMFLSKPIRRPALKQVLQKFATIEEESEIPLSGGIGGSGNGNGAAVAAASSSTPHRVSSLHRSTPPPPSTTKLPVCAPSTVEKGDVAKNKEPNGASTPDNDGGRRTSISDEKNAS